MAELTRLELFEIRAMARGDDEMLREEYEAAVEAWCGNPACCDPPDKPQKYRKAELRQALRQLLEAHQVAQSEEAKAKKECQEMRTQRDNAAEMMGAANRRAADTSRRGKLVQTMAASLGDLTLDDLRVLFESLIQAIDERKPDATPRS